MPEKPGRLTCAEFYDIVATTTQTSLAMCSDAQSLGPMGQISGAGPISRLDLGG